MSIKSGNSFLFILFVFILSAFACQKTVDNSEDISALRNEILALQQRTDSLVNALKLTNNNLDNISVRIDSVETVLTGITLKLDSLNKVVVSNNADIQSLKKDILELQQLYQSLLLQLNDILAISGTVTLNNGLIGFFPFSGNANDLSTVGNNGIVIGAILTKDRFGAPSAAYYFDRSHWTWGAGGDEIFIPYNSNYDTKTISVSVWINRKSNLTGQGYIVAGRFQFGYDNPNGQVWFINIDPSNSYNTTSNILAPSSVNSQQMLECVGPANSINQWVNLVFTFDGIVFNQYINGVLTDSKMANGFELNTLGKSGISVGLSDQANGHWGPFDGSIDDLRIYNRALNPNEIAYLATH